MLTTGGDGTKAKHSELLHMRLVMFLSVDALQVRKAWMKANLLVHPDKVRQRNGGDEQVAIADMIFDALKEAWGQFRG